MSTVAEHLARLREIANRYGPNMHGLRQNDRDFQFEAILFCGVHLDELDAMVNKGQPPGRLTDTQIRDVLVGRASPMEPGYEEAYKLVRSVESALLAHYSASDVVSSRGVALPRAGQQ